MDLMLDRSLGNNIIMFFMDSVGWKDFNDAKTPFLDSIGIPQKAVAFGTWTIPSMFSAFYGHIPRPIDTGNFEIKHYNIRENRWADEFNKNFNTYFLTTNATFYGFEHERFFHKFIDRDTTPELIDWFEKNVKEPFLVIFLITETHWHEDWERGKEREIKLKRIEYIDSQIKRLWKISPPNTKFYITSDHADYYKPNGTFLGHDPRDKRLCQPDVLKCLLEVFVIESLKVPHDKKPKDFESEVDKIMKGFM